MERLCGKLRGLRAGTQRSPAVRSVGSHQRGLGDRRYEMRARGGTYGTRRVPLKPGIAEVGCHSPPRKLALGPVHLLIRLLL